MLLYLARVIKGEIENVDRIDDATQVTVVVENGEDANQIHREFTAKLQKRGWKSIPTSIDYTKRNASGLLKFTAFKEPAPGTFSSLAVLD